MNEDPIYSTILDVVDNCVERMFEELVSETGMTTGDFDPMLNLRLERAKEVLHDICYQHYKNNKPAKTEVFVFGSNLAGIHGAGSAREALKHGAMDGFGFGRQGNSYAIPTKDEKLRPLSLDKIDSGVRGFLNYAEHHPECVFNVVPIGCGFAGYVPGQIAPMFVGYPSNVNLPWEFKLVLEDVPSLDPLVDR